MTDELHDELADALHRIRDEITLLTARKRLGKCNEIVRAHRHFNLALAKYLKAKEQDNARNQPAP